VCTNKLEGLSVLLLDKLGLAARFAAICGQDTFGVPKPDPELLRRTIARAGGGLDQAVMVGDSEPDVAVARAAGVPVIAVDFGYSEIAVEQLAPDRIISHFDDLPDAVADVLARRARRANDGPVAPPPAPYGPGQGRRRPGRCERMLSCAE
jgi:phosphoglycolate phosphatase